MFGFFWHFADTVSPDRWKFSPDNSGRTRSVRVHTQTPTQCSLDWNDNTELPNTQTHFVISLSDLSLSLLLVLQRQPIFCAAAHYAGWWLSPCQLTVQLAYLRLAQTLILAGERTVYTYWCPHSYALACTYLTVKQLWHMRGEALCKSSDYRADPWFKCEPHGCLCT